MAKIPVYSDIGQIVALVEYNDNLDFWDGHNMTCGQTGKHKGITRLKKSGKYVLIHGSQYQGERSYAEIITDREAYEEIVNSENRKLFEKFPDLLKINESLDQEEGEEEIPTTIQVSRGVKDRLTALKITPGETYQEILLRLVPGLQEDKS